MNLSASWQALLAEEFEKDYFRNLMAFVNEEYRTQRCYPPASEVFNAFNLCPLDKVSVVIIGQDPYHGPGQAEGLCFSVKEGVDLPPSLVNILKEVKDDTGRVPEVLFRDQQGVVHHDDGLLSVDRGAGKRLYNGSLRRWAEQGVLLLNATLTVREHQPGSHQRRGWETFTDAVIKKVSEQVPHCVFLLWGGYARSKASLIDKQRHLVLESVHPSPLSANRGGWFGNHHFSLCNQFLVEHQCKAIEW